MSRRLPVVLATTALLVAGLLGGSPAAGAPSDPTPGPEPTDTGLDVYTGTVDAEGLDQLGKAGVDRDHAVVAPAEDGAAEVEVVLSRGQAKSLQDKGVGLELKKVDGKTSAQLMAAEAADGFEVWTSYSEPGGIRDDMVDTTQSNPDITKLVPVGTSVQGQEIFAVKVTKNAGTTKDGKRPAVLYTANQHAREWITPEMVQRLMHYVIDGYGNDPEITRLVDTTELWFLPSQNPDGYDFTFTGDRMWRKNLRDVNGDGQITIGDGVDTNRNFPYKWGYDNEGSTPQSSGETYRGEGPASEPEVRALLGLMERVGFEYAINYHSAAELLLYGAGWQVETPTPDDEIYTALAGDDEDPAVPGYDPDISAELYTTNGDTDGHTHEVLGTLTFTPEMSTCQTASAVDPADEFEPGDCGSGFHFPDSEALVQAEFEKNIPFALSLAKSAADPDDPKSSVGDVADDLVVDTFETSYGANQEVAVNAKRALQDLRMHYRIGNRHTAVTVDEWTGGDKYGGAMDKYYAEYRGTVRSASPGDEVTVWFTGVKAGKGMVRSDEFTYTVAGDTGGDVLVLAAEDYTGLSPVQAGGPSYVDDYAAMIEQAGYSTDVYDVDAQDRTAPHHLGVLSHYDAVVWETGEDVIPRNAGQVPGTAAKWTYDTELNVRDYVNEGGKLLVAGKYALFGQGADGSYWYNPYEAEQGGCTTAEEYPCLPLFNDFMQYWLGAYQYVDGGGHNAAGETYPLAGTAGGPFDGFAALLNGGDSADNQDHSAAFVSTSSYLPAEEFPQFSSSAPMKWDRGGADPYAPVTGDWYMYSQTADQSYKRLSRTVDLTGATSGALDVKISADTELDWDYVFVEAHTVGQDDWTTLPDANGHTTQDTGESCPAGWADELHPFLFHYQGADCTPAGTTGQWHAASGNSAGWQDWSVDLSQFAGSQVEVSISYVSDWSTQGLGVFVDDAVLSADGQPVAETSFETDTGGWQVPGAPEGSAGNGTDWVRSEQAIEEGATVTTDNTVYAGFGAEGLQTQAQRDDFMAQALEHLLG
ncbi:MAG: zinc carboxypeptidase [Propionibacteriales bacterium]|nr:zinc carboxypeptidase [Propionibacteriales bacterium]